MDRHSLTSDRPLDYYLLPPVRGRLEPQDASTTNGWRFIQCTDTPNQLKVLLPPRTATLYAHILKLEKHELDQGAHALWPRIMELRHLKDRMLRKCQRIAVPQQQALVTDTTFRTVYAPPDFRLKEMERWIKNHEPGARTHSKAAAGQNQHAQHDGYQRQPSYRAPSIHEQAHGHEPAYPHDEHEHDSPPRGSYVPSHGGDRDGRSLSPVDFPAPASFPVPDLSPEPGLPNPTLSGPAADLSTYTGLHGHGHDEPLAGVGVPFPSASFADDAAQTLSPEPLPHPYRHRALSPLMEHPDEHFGFPVSSENTPQQPTPLTGDTNGSFADEQGRRPIVRRRSSLKRQNSATRLSEGKVAWAMDMSRADLAAREVELAGNELSELREMCRSQLSDIQHERMGIAESLQRLHMLEESLRHQEERLHATYQELEQKELQYRSKVMAVLDEAKRVVQMKQQEP